MSTLIDIAKETVEGYVVSEKPFVCKYCNRGFSKEKTLASHVCEQKRRWQQEKDKHVQVGMQAYVRFFEKTQGNTRASNKTYGDFANSPYYNAFVKFGKHVMDIRAINTAKFIDWVIDNNIKLDQWTYDVHYEKYIDTHLRVESWQDAVSRSLKTMENWADEHEVQLNTYFFAGKLTKICHDVVHGRVSSWVIFNCESGVNFLSKVNEEQLALIYPYIDPDFWQKNFIKYHNETEIVKSALKDAGL
tara:strand:+ start:4580 stop:5317 length:738 start_codon:yes stop_codon:yes gene_type:complete